MIIRKIDNRIFRLIEAAYAGNLGLVELFKFYKVANEQQRHDMKVAIDQKDIDTFYRLIKQVVGISLKR